MKTMRITLQSVLREVRGNLMMTIVLLASYALFFVFISQTSGGFVITRIALAVGILLLGVIWADAGMNPFSKLQTAESGDSGEKSEENKSRAARFRTAAWTVLLTHVAGPCLVGAGVTAIVSVLDDNPAGKAKYMLLQLPAAIALSLMIATMFAVWAVFREDAGKHFSIEFVYVTLASGALGLVVLGLLGGWAGIRLHRMVFPWEYRMVMDDAAGHRGLRYNEIMWILQGVYRCLISVAVLFLLRLVRSRGKDAAETPKRAGAVWFGIASSLAVFLLYSLNFILGVCSFGVAVLVLGLVYMTLWWLYGFLWGEKSENTSRRVRLAVGLFFGVTSAYAVLSWGIYVTNGLGMARCLPAESLDESDLLIEINGDRDVPMQLLFHAGSCSVLYYPEGDKYAVSAMEAVPLGDAKLREIASAVQKQITARERGFGTYLEMLWNGSPLCARLPGDAAAAENECFMSIYRASNEEYASEPFNLDLAVDRYAEANRKEYALRQVAQLSREQLQSLIQKLRAESILTERKGTAFRYFWNPDAKP